MMIKIYGFPRSRSLRAVWTAEEAGIDYEFVRVDLQKGAHRKDPFATLNPTGKVPVLTDGDLVVSESPAICTYIAQQDKSRGLVPDNTPAERAVYDKWCCFVISELEQPLWTISKHTFSLPEEKRIPEVKNTAKFEFALVLDSLSTQLGSAEFVMADRFTVADVLVSHTLMWGLAARQSLVHGNLKDYVRRSSARAALVRAREAES